jgi:hypothetical protein
LSHNTCSRFNDEMLNNALLRVHVRAVTSSPHNRHQHPQPSILPK